MTHPAPVSRAVLAKLAAELAEIRRSVAAQGSSSGGVAIGWLTPSQVDAIIAAAQPAPPVVVSEGMALAAARECSGQCGESHDAMWEQMDEKERAEFVAEWKAIITAALTSPTPVGELDEDAQCSNLCGRLGKHDLESCELLCDECYIERCEQVCERTEKDLAALPDHLCRLIEAVRIPGLDDGERWNSAVDECVRAIRAYNPALHADQKAAPVGSSEGGA